MKVSLAPRLHLKRWAIPLAYAAGTLTVGMLLPRLEHHFLPNLVSTMSSSAAMTIGSAIASGMIALTGIVFSLTFVMVQFSATAYSPRLVLWIAREPLLWHSIGIFSATFLYALGAISWVQRAHAGTGVPFFSAWLVIALLVASVGVFIALIQRMSLLQVYRMLTFTADHGRRVIEKTYPPIEAPPSVPSAQGLGSSQPSRTLRYAGQPLSLQALDIR